MRETIDKIRENMKGKLDELQSLKAKKEELLNELNQMREALKVDDKAKTEGVSNLAAIQRRIRELEWQVQTNSLDIEEEKRLVKRIEELRKKENELKKYAKLKEKYKEGRAQLLAKKVELSTVRSKMTEIVGELKIQRELLEKKKAERDAIVNQIIELKKRIEELSAMIDKLGNDVSEKQKELGSAIEMSRRGSQTWSRQEEQRIMEKKKEEVKEKMKKTNRLSFHEFRILYDGAQGSDGE
ncbi:hypothetical protein HS1genome_1046 [Sulfodiicoccus acidiphilus]|uniref:Uncharacterized protein n=1 Tax=Sulfodiicoccus acidiphilus TaxID=1670455 RepID=A0A348B3A5_9CREN|nr:hypothetical protein HS1genome_1046 [Sulfodiicoccus acidiphilus]